MIRLKIGCLIPVLVLFIGALKAAPDVTGDDVALALKDVSGEGPFTQPDAALRKQRMQELANDNRDWEETLATILASDDPESYRVFGILRVRKTAGDSRIIDALCGQLDRRASELRLMDPASTGFDQTQRHFRLRFSMAAATGVPEILLYLIESLNRPDSGFRDAIKGIPLSQLLQEELLKNDNEEIRAIAETVDTSEGRMTCDIHYESLLQKLAENGDERHLPGIRVLGERLAADGRTRLAREAERTAGIVERRTIGHERRRPPTMPEGPSHATAASESDQSDSAGSFHRLLIPSINSAGRTKDTKSNLSLSCNLFHPRSNVSRSRTRSRTLPVPFGTPRPSTSSLWQ